MKNSEQKLNQAKRKFRKQTKKFALKPVAAGVASALLCNVPASVSAQTELEEIIVTATRRAESVLDIPYNLSVLSNDDLRAARAIGLGDLARLVPGVSYVDQGPVARAQNNNFTLRGLNISSASNNGDISALSQAAVSTYVGETPIFYNITLKDMDRVEVLRGPQGTLYGSGSLGGTIRFLPNQPDFAGVAVEFDSSVSLTEDSDQVSYSADGVINLPIVDNVLAARIATGYTREGGFVDALGRVVLDDSGVPVPRIADDISSGMIIGPEQEDVNDLDQYYVRLSLLWQPSENLSASLRYQHDYTEQDDEQFINPNVPSLTVNTSAGQVPGSRFVDAGSCGPGIEFPGYYFCGAEMPFPNGATTFPATGDRDHLKLHPEPFESEVDSVALDIELDFGFGTLTSATSYYEVREDSVNDITGDLEVTQAEGGVSYASFYFFYPRFTHMAPVTVNIDGFAQEVRFVTDWDKRWDFVLGAFYQDTDSDIHFADFSPGLSAWDQAVFYYGFNNTTLPDLQFEYDRQLQFEDLAVFGELTFQVTEQWQVTGGFRAFFQEQEIDLVQRIPFCGPYCANDLTDIEGTTAITDMKEEVDDQIFRVNTSYEVNEDTMAYFTWAEGFRRGGANSIPLAGSIASLPEFQTYRPDQVTNYEAGIKGRLWDRRLSYTLAGFFIEWEDLQFDAFTPSFVPVVLNGSEAESIGVELELDAQINEALSVNLGYAYTDAEATADKEIIDLDLGGGQLISSNEVFDGDPVPNVPQHSLTLGLDFSQPLTFGNNWMLNWHVDGSFRDETQTAFNSLAENFYTLDSFWMWNGSVTLSADNWDLGLFVRNIGDEEGITGGQGEGFSGTRGQFFYTARPRSVGLSFSYRFF